jgi:hypothetical protein
MIWWLTHAVSHGDEVSRYTVRIRGGDSRIHHAVGASASGHGCTDAIYDHQALLGGIRGNSWHSSCGARGLSPISGHPAPLPAAAGLAARGVPVDRQASRPKPGVERDDPPPGARLTRWVVTQYEFWGKLKHLGRMVAGEFRVREGSKLYDDRYPSSRCLGRRQGACKGCSSSSDGSATIAS